jgi:predicted HicB family RNase H-like nuclease
MVMKEGTQSIYVRVPKELKLQIEMEATRQGRSVNNFITYVMIEYLKEKERKK